MSLSGNLEDVSVADALQFIHLGGRTGTLTLVSGDLNAGIGFHQGRIVNAWGPGTKKLGELLVEDGAIDRSTLASALRQQEHEQPRRSLGQILIADHGLSEERMYRAVEQQIEKTVYDLVTWKSGTFHFALDDLKPIDDISVYPGDIVGRLHLDTQMVLLDALRLFDEKNRSASEEGEEEATARLPIPKAARAPTPVAVKPVPPPVLQAKPRLQVVSADRGLADRLIQALAPGEATVVKLTLRDAGTPPHGEPPPVVLIDLRGGAIALESVQQLRRARPRASILAVVDSGVPLAQTYEAGAMAVVPGEVPSIVAGFKSVVENRRDLMGSGQRTERVNANFAKLRRIVGDLRSGLISTSISLSLMNIISESVERAVLFLVRRDALASLGAFGNAAGGKPLAQLTRGMVLSLEGQGALSGAVSDGLVHALKFEEARLPAPFAEAIGRPHSGQCAIFPVLGGARVIAVIYADNGQANRAIEEMDILELAASQAGLAFENELLRRQVAPT
jgi:hypothetical protein